MNLEKAKSLLLAADLFFDTEDGEDGTPPWTLNLNDAFGWACADGETVPEGCIVELATLYHRYGMCGVYWWVLKRRGVDSVEFADVNRCVQFVAAEEEIRRLVPSSSDRAYHQATYTIGVKA